MAVQQNIEGEDVKNNEERIWNNQCLPCNYAQKENMVWSRDSETTITLTWDKSTLENCWIIVNITKP